MKKVIITILGTITCCDFKTGECDKQRRAFYTVDEKLKSVLDLKRSNYTNMFPVVIESFKDKYEIVPIYTTKKKVETVQKRYRKKF